MTTTAKTILSTIRKERDDDFKELSCVEYDINKENTIDSDLSKFLSLIEEEDNKNNDNSSSSDNKNNSNNGSNLRDKDAELKKKIKQFLSKDTSNMIDANEEELDEIIKGLKKLGISNNKGAELQRIISLKKSRIRMR